MNGEELYERSVAELARLNARVIEHEVRRRVVEQIAERGLVARAAEDQPSAEAFMRALYRVFDEKMREQNPGTYVGGAKIVKDVAVALGVTGAGSLPYLRRTRAQVDAAPNPHVAREGRARPRTIERLEDHRRWGA